MLIVWVYLMQSKDGGDSKDCAVFCEPQMSSGHRSSSPNGVGCGSDRFATSTKRIWVEPRALRADVERAFTYVRTLDAPCNLDKNIRFGFCSPLNFER
jgi:hypothetical protein